MSKGFLFISVFLLLAVKPTIAQISHGGKPLAWNALSGIESRSAEASLFVDMPSFDVEEELRIDSLNESDTRGGYRFAYKFITDYNPNNSGVNFTLPDGTRVWRLGIRSPGAYSINILFTRYELPEGAQLFLYNPDRSQILGSFNQMNNSESGILPVAPVQGDELIIEYQEPAKAAFRGKLTVGEVNHAYRDLRGDEPRPGSDEYKAIPPLACYATGGSIYEPLGRSVVMMLIDGVIACSGTLVNNMQNDGKPYLLTASHCLNRSFTVSNPDYQKVAGRIVFFFNYDSPTCNTILKGTEEMSVASAKSIAINEQTDLALLELSQRPPVYYQPYYAGWNATQISNPPYAGIHHPGGSVKRICLSEDNIKLSTFNTIGTYFYDNCHWHVQKWSDGFTSKGSSGSALFDSEGYVIGALSGGLSMQDKPFDDFYYALSQTWTISEETDKQLKYWLDPANTNKLLCKGLDPYEQDRCLKLSNVEATGKQELIETASIPATNTEPLFGNNSLGVTECAEAYTITGKALIYGAYFVTPSVTGSYKDLNVEVNVYGGTDKPQTLLHTEPFRPSYQNLNTSDNSFQETDKPLNRSQETYIHFSKPVAVDGTFYISYKITAPKGTTFSVYNLPKGETTKNTAWANYNGKWIEATTYPQNPFSTSLYIDPVIQYTTSVGIEDIEDNNPIRIYLENNHKTLRVLLPSGTEKASYELLSLEGKILQAGNIRSNIGIIPVNVSAKGIYLVKITCNNRYYTQKLIF
ncbi:trypsin-like peptidase domain-containing protein [Parabacteroides chinchillae]